MHQLAGRLTALDPDAGEALRVIAYFDELVHQRTGLESVVRGAAVLSGAPARLSTPSRRMALRVGPDGRRDDEPSPPDPSWQTITLDDPDVTLWLERPGPSGPVDAMVLERGAQAARTVLERTRGRHTAPLRDTELLEVLLDPEAPASARGRAIRGLGFTPGQAVRIVVGGVGMRVVPAGSVSPAATHDAGERAGVGPPVPVEDVAATIDQARLAYRLTAEGTPADPGDRLVLVDQIGVAILVAAGCDQQPEWARHPDVEALTQASGQIAWLLPTLTALAATESLRAAAGRLLVHHSTLQQRLVQIQKCLGWDVTTPTGKLRLQVALMVRRLELSR